GDPVAPHAILTVTALLFLLYGLLSRRLARGVITAPMLAVAAGLAAGPLGLGWIELPLAGGAVATVGEVALAVLLFTGAAAPDGELSVPWTLPARLLLLGLPLGRAALDTLRELGLGAALGAAVGWAGGRALDAAWRRGWTDETFARLVSPGLAVVALGLAGLCGVDGLVAACCAGLALSARDPD